MVGLFGPAVYEQSQITLMESDLLIGFTDGVNEAMNSADEEWGGGGRVGAVGEGAARDGSG